MDATEFDVAAARTRLKPRALRMARAVLLEGIGATEAGVREGLTRQAARAAVARVMREHRGAGGYPRDWVVRTVVVPPDVAEQIDDLERSALSRAGLS
ncbi:MAG: TrfB-related DNA-binding protein [Pseudomonadota bacterium]